MEKAAENRIRELAQPLWESAARPYGMALDFWLMAEQMVLEMMSASARMQVARNQEQWGAFADTAVKQLPDAAPVGRIRDLAQCMWETAGRQYGMAQDFWLAAERHVLAMMRAATGAASDHGQQLGELAALSPGEYLERIRTMSYLMWQAAGQQYGQTLDFWLQAEREILNAFSAAAQEGGTGIGASVPHPDVSPSTVRESADAEPAPSAEASPDALSEQLAAPPAAVAVKEAAAGAKKSQAAKRPRARRKSAATS